MTDPATAAGPAPVPVRARPAELVAQAGLPAGVAEVVLATAAATRLWRSERADVTRELCSHFAEGLAAGRAPVELIADFGDPRRVAVLIRRAKKRNRPALWRLWVQACKGVGALLLVSVVLYAFLAFRYYTGSPTVAHDYAAELNAPIAAIAEADRAWPLYRQAVAAVPKLPDVLTARWGRIRTGDPEWPDAVAYLEQCRAALELVRLGAAKPGLGAGLPTHAGTAGAPLELDAAMSAVWPELLSRMRQLTRLLVEDTWRAEAANDRAGTVGDLVAIIRMAEHARGAPFLINDAVGVAVLDSALQTLGELMDRSPALLDEAGLVALAHRLGAFSGGGPVVVHVEGERALFRDMVQRSFTDDGRGDGRCIAAGSNRLYPTGSGAAGSATMLDTLTGPLAGLVSPGRRRTVEEYEQVLSLVATEAAKPLYARTFEGESVEVRATGDRTVRPSPMGSMLVPSFIALSTQAELITQRRDGALVLIALELYRRASGGYPASLDVLVPDRLPAVPIDRFDGKPLKYRLRDGRPVLYSVGLDGVDDGGMPPPDPYGNTRAAHWLPPAQLRKMMAEPAQFRPGLGGDWVLWPPIRYDEDGKRIDE